MSELKEIDYRRILDWVYTLQVAGLFTSEELETSSKVNNLLIEILDKKDKVSLRTAPDS